MGRTEDGARSVETDALRHLLRRPGTGTAKQWKRGHEGRGGDDGGEGGCGELHLELCSGGSKNKTIGDRSSNREREKGACGRGSWVVSQKRT